MYTPTRLFYTHLLLALFLGNGIVFSQRNVAITIDDVPNTRNFEANNYNSALLNQFDTLNIPIAIFINEGLIYKTNKLEKNKELLINWIQKEYVTVGNHTYSHSRYSDVGYDNFKTDIEKGEQLTQEIASKLNKPSLYFRFPYNDLGADSLEHIKMDSTLITKGYYSAPFTIESSDWMYNHVYEYYITHSEPEKALEIGKMYVSKTLAYFDFFDSLAIKEYNHEVNQIYLCHDNTINSIFLIDIIQKLKEKQYQFIGLEEAIMDPIYQQESKYYKKWGISWFYRWMPTQNERIRWMKQEPDMQDIETIYNLLSK